MSKFEEAAEVGIAAVKEKLDQIATANAAHNRTATYQLVCDLSELSLALTHTLQAITFAEWQARP